MTIGKMFKSIMPFVKPYKWLVVGTLAMTFIGSLMAQGMKLFEEVGGGKF